MNDPTSTDELELLRKIVEKMAVAVYSIRNGRFAYVNAKFAKALGYTCEEVLAFDSVLQVISEDHREAVAEMLRRRDAGDVTDVRFVTTVRRRDGALLDAEVHGSVSELGGDRILIGAAVDITEHLASSRQLRERQEYFRALTENVSDIIAILDADGMLKYISPSVTRVLGYRPADLLGYSSLGCVHPDDSAVFFNALVDLIDGGTRGPADYRFQHENGTWRVMELVGTNLLEHDQIQGIVLNLRDVTDRRRMEKEVAQIHRFTSLGRLAAQVAHEFNNVLMGIQPMIDVLRRQTSENPVLLRQIDSISASISRGKRITTDILRFGHPAEPTRRPVRVDEILDKTVHEIRPMLPDGIKLDLVLSEVPLVDADPAQLSQVLINLALNARDAMPDGGTLTMGASLAKAGEIGGTQRFVHFKVSDTGTGITAEDLPHIFQPLFTTKKTGTGLGLSVVYQIATAHGGHISVESEPGVGSTFDLFIPAATRTDCAVEADDIARPEPMSGKRILLAEDEKTIALGLRLSLEEEGFDVRVVGRGAEVLPAIEAFDPDVLVLDIALPDADGRDVYADVSQRFALPVVFSSGHVAELELDQLSVPGRTDFLMKPYSTSDLLHAIRGLLESRDNDPELQCHPAARTTEGPFRRGRRVSTDVVAVNCSRARHHL